MKPGLESILNNEFKSQVLKETTKDVHHKPHCQVVRVVLNFQFCFLIFPLFERFKIKSLSKNFPGPEKFLNLQKSLIP